MCSAPDVPDPVQRQDSKMPERSARGDAMDPLKRKRGYAALLRGAAAADTAGAAVTTGNAAGKLGAS